MNPEWHLLSWNELSADDLHDILKLRVDVFVVEQDCPYPEIDGKDRDSIHLLARANDDIVAYLRIVPPGLAYEEVAIGRVIVDDRFRGKGLGHELMERAMAAIEETYGRVPVRLGAQEHLVRYYQKHKFVTAGESYLEDGIPHIEMLYTP